MAKIYVMDPYAHVTPKVRRNNALIAGGLVAFVGGVWYYTFSKMKNVGAARETGRLGECHSKAVADTLLVPLRAIFKRDNADSCDVTCTLTYFAGRSCCAGQRIG